MPVSEWEGNKWILTESLAEEGFYVQFFDSDDKVIVQFIMACSGLQSMIIFVGAIGALSSVSWKRRARGLLIALPTIYVLNMFRNAGIVWLTETYPEWSLMGIEMFDFTHSYAAKGNFTICNVLDGYSTIRFVARIAQTYHENFGPDI
jgi:exosortase/archaeosortase family protein